MDHFNASWCFLAGLTWRQVVILRAVRQVPAPDRHRVLAGATSGVPPWRPTRRSRRILVGLFPRPGFDPLHRSAMAVAAADQGQGAAVSRSNWAAVSVAGSGQHPALVPDADPGHPTHHRSSSAPPTSRPKSLCGLQARPASQSPTCPAPRPAVRDLRVLAAVRGRAPALRRRRPRRAALVRPPRGLPHRDPRAGQGADGQERGDRAGRRQGRLRAEAATAEPDREARQAEGGGLLPGVHLGAAGRHRQPGRRRGRSAAATWSGYDGDDPYLVVAADKGTATFSDIANEISVSVRLLAGRRVRLGRIGRLRPQGDGHHRPRRLGVGQRHFRELGDRRPDRRDFTVVGIGDMSGDVFGNGMLLADTSSWSPRSTTGTSSSTRTPIRRVLVRRAAAAVRPAALVAGPTTTRALISERRRRLAAHGQVRSDRRPQVRAAARPRATRGRARSRRAELIQRDPAGAGRPAVERRHRHLRQGGRPRPHADVGDKANDAVRVNGAELRARGRRRRRQPRLHPARAGSSTRLRRRPDQHRLHRQLGGGGLLRPRGQHQDPARRPRSTTGSSTGASATPCWPR